jgi:hypothetical protein
MYVSFFLKLRVCAVKLKIFLLIFNIYKYFNSIVVEHSFLLCYLIIIIIIIIIIKNTVQYTHRKILMK